MSVGFLATGPISGRLSDRYGQKWFATLGMAAAACTFVLLLVLPVNFPYPLFGLLILVNGLGVGMFSAPNTTTMMNSVPAADRGAASGMRATAMNAGFVLSIGIFFSLMIVGLSAHLPTALGHGLISRGVAASTADRVAALPAVATLFAAFLGVNPMKQLLGPHVLRQVGTAHAQVITGKSFFPSLISEPFHSGLTIAFAVSAVLCALAAFFSFWAGDSGAAASGRSVRPEPERFVDGHSTAPIGGIDAALPDVVEV
jgi:MFS family permease